MTRPTCRLLKATALILLAILCCNTVLASNRVPQRRGKVIIIRGAFTVFSLGMNELGDKLAERGFDVDVIADISAGRVTAQIVSEYQRNRNVGPIVLIGHSRGAELGPKQARELQRYRIPVKLVVMVDAVHQTTIPGNVERCVNLYHNNSLGLLHGVPARAESKKTQMFNTDIDRLRSRQRGGSINHFNIDSSPWIHDLVMSEVLKACPVAGADPETNVASKATSRQPSSQTVRRPSTQTTQRATTPSTTTQHPSTPAVTQRPSRTVTPQRSRSGLRYPSGVTGGLWAGSTADRSTAETSPQSTSSATKSDSRSTYRSGRATSPQRSSASRSRSAPQRSPTKAAPRTAARPKSTKLQRPPAAGQLRAPPSSTSQSSTTDTKRPAAPTKPQSKQAQSKQAQSSKPQSSKPQSSTSPSKTSNSKTSDAASKTISDSRTSSKKETKPVKVKVDG